jgi:hypothetical protein
MPKASTHALEGSVVQRVSIRQIFYDSASRASIRDGYVALDNTTGPANWFEFWPMLKFVRETVLEDDVWYGVVSPKFPKKACLTQAQVAAVLERDPAADVALFSYDWASLATNLNPWVQGEGFHPGLIACMEQFLRSQGQPVDLRRIVADFDTSVLANYFVAKRAFWHRWRDLAERYLNYVQAGGETLPDNLDSTHRDRQYPMRAFVQERLVCWLLITGNERIARPDYVRDVPLPSYSPFRDQPFAKPLLWLCDAVKRWARRSGRSGPLFVHRLAVKLLWLVHKFAQEPIRQGRRGVQA